MPLNKAFVDVRKEIRDYVNHPAARAWANKVIDSFDHEMVAAGDAATAMNRMKYFLMDNDGTTLLDSTFIINSKTISYMLCIFVVS